jgi:hypothetical protein
VVTRYEVEIDVPNLDQYYASYGVRYLSESGTTKQYSGSPGSRSWEKVVEAIQSYLENLSGRERRPEPSRDNVELEVTPIFEGDFTIEDILDLTTLSEFTGGNKEPRFREGSWFESTSEYEKWVKPIFDGRVLRVDGEDLTKLYTAWIWSEEGKLREYVVTERGEYRIFFQGMENKPDNEKTRSDFDELDIVESAVDSPIVDDVGHVHIAKLVTRIGGEKYKKFPDWTQAHFVDEDQLPEEVVKRWSS